jgi:hypothetical protein
MRCFHRILLALTVVAVCLTCGGEVSAKGGRGGFGGGGGGFKGGGGGSHFGGGHQGGTFNGGGHSKAGKAQFGGGRPAGRFSTQNATTGNLTGGNQPWSWQQAREQRKLNQRQQVADHLRRISDLNGNQQLQQVANDMDQRAQSHYNRQMQKIKQQYGLDDLDNGAGAANAPSGNVADNTPASGDDPTGSLANSPVNPAPSPGQNPLGDAGDAVNQSALNDVANKLTGRENALYRQLQNEQRKLSQRMQTVNQMRQLANQTGDQGMLNAADRLEDWSMNHFDQRMMQITDFQQRHNLPDVSQYLAP